MPVKISSRLAAAAFVASACLGLPARGDEGATEVALVSPQRRAVESASRALEDAARAAEGGAASRSELCTIESAARALEAATRALAAAARLPEPGLAGATIPAVIPASAAAAPQARPARPLETSAASAEGARGLLAQAGKIADVNPKLKLQARIDYGDLLENDDGTAYATGYDSYVKKIKFGFGGRLLGRGKYSVTFNAEHIGQNGKSANMKLDRAYVDYSFADALGVRFGRTKLPLSRGTLLASNDVFLEDAAVVDTAEDQFSDDNQVHLQLRGSAAGGVASWFAAIADGWSPGEEIHDLDVGGRVRRGQPLLVVRGELALPGFTEPLEDAEPGRGRRISVGGSLSSQRGIRYAEIEGHEDRWLASLDVTARVGPFSAVVEGDTWRVSSTLPAVGRTQPWGWYVQAGWFLAGPNVEPVARYESFREGSARGASQQALSLGTTWYLRGDNAKVAVNWVYRELGPASADRLARASRQNVLQIGGELSF